MWRANIGVPIRVGLIQAGMVQLFLCVGNMNSEASSFLWILVRKAPAQGLANGSVASRSATLHVNSLISVFKLDVGLFFFLALLLSCSLALLLSCFLRSGSGSVTDARVRHCLGTPTGTDKRICRVVSTWDSCVFTVLV